MNPSTVLNLYKKYVYCLFIVLGSSTLLQAQLFNEISQAIGIDHFQDSSNNLGGGVAIFDYDGDGDEDVYLTGGFDADKLYRNNGDGTFSDVTQQAGISLTGNVYTTVAITGDIDNDGDRDIFVGTTTEIFGADFRNLLLLNNGNGTFSEVGSLAGFNNETVETLGATFIDYDQDSFLDIYVVNYIETNNFVMDSTGMINGFDHDCYSNHFYHNNGDGTFTERAAELGLADSGCALAVTATDYDMDADLDIYLANDFGEFVIPNGMFQNQLGTADTFLNIAPTSGLDIGLYGMGIATGDYDQDGDFDYYVTNLGRNVLLDNDGTGQFSDVTTFAQVENTWVIEDSLLTTSWGTAFLDYDNDTHLDLFVTNGRIPASNFIATGFSDPNKLYRNNGDKTFSDVSIPAGIADPNRGRGMAHFDYDNDGDLDMIVPVLNTSLGAFWTKFYENKNTNNNNWLKVKLTGTTCNRDAFGSKINIQVGDKVLIREISAGASHCSQHSSIAHFGLGENVENIEQLIVEWPSGEPRIEVYENVPTNQTLELIQGGGQPNLPVLVTFQVDMRTIDVANGGISMAADFENWAGSIVLEDADADGIYTSTQSLAAGEYQYKFINGFSSTLNNWEQLDESAHADCTVTMNGSTNRIVEVGEEDLTIEAACFESCHECFIDPAPVFVTFQVDMAEVGASPDGVFIGANFNSWEGIALEDPDGDDIYSKTVATLGGEFLYRYVNGSTDNFENWESLDEDQDNTCTSQEGGLSYRYIDIKEDIILEPVCFNSCTLCIPDAVSNINQAAQLFSIQPTLTKDEINIHFLLDTPQTKQLSIYNSTGHLVGQKTVGKQEQAVQWFLRDYPVGLYIVQVQMGMQFGTKRIVVVD